MVRFSDFKHVFQCSIYISYNIYLINVKLQIPVVKLLRLDRFCQNQKNVRFGVQQVTITDKTDVFN